MIIAKRIIGGRVVEKKFTDLSWTLLGKNKQGWEKVDLIENAPPKLEVREFLTEKKSVAVVPPVAVKEEPKPEVVEIPEEPVKKPGRPFKKVKK
jgi:hypothetical protein